MRPQLRTQEVSKNISVLPFYELFANEQDPFRLSVVCFDVWGVLLYNVRVYMYRKVINQLQFELIYL